ncbi:MAG: L,D-transpeptidase family protein [Methylocystis sp.]|uniref:L,D-transpeptidase family protein n=1 Tax=Methylocystis sp. TaxID=1911079 RepID=UPI003DA6C108
MKPRSTHILFAALALAALGLGVAALRYLPGAGKTRGVARAVASTAAPHPAGGAILPGLRRGLIPPSTEPESASPTPPPASLAAVPPLRGAEAPAADAPPAAQIAALPSPAAPAEEAIQATVSFPPVAPRPPARPSELQNAGAPLPPVRPRDLAAVAPAPEPATPQQQPPQPSQPAAPAQTPAPAPALSGWSFQWPQAAQPTPGHAVAAAPAPAPAPAAAPVYADVPTPPARPAGLDRLASLSTRETDATAPQPAPATQATPAEGAQVARLEEPTLKPAPDDAFQSPPPKFGMGDPVFVRIFKQEGQLELWLKKNGRYALYKTFPICKWSGRLGPKLKEADYQSPEGFYSVSAKQLNPHSNYYRAFNVGYPNAFDRQNGRTGGLVMVHGACKSVGCFAMTDRGIEEIYGFVEAALRAGQKEVPVHIFPFHMTDANIARETGASGGWLSFVSGGGGNTQWAGFWRNLKQGHDLFEQSGEPPVAFACGDHYEFDGGSSACRRVAGW